ncbi:MAG TPA: acyl-CoA dehydrogenase family protein, partial [Streptosporangiaceae bacterium]
MDFAFDDRTHELRERLNAFMDEHVRPAEATFREQEEAAVAEGREWERVPVTAELKREARSRGLWNLFLTGRSAEAVRKWEAATGAAHSLLPDPPLTNLQYAPLAEITGWNPALAPEALNCAAPDTGNMEVLAEFGSPEQQERWLRPLLEGEIRSAFCMTEPAVASSDANNIATTITRDGDEYVVNGRKWWSSGALSSACKIFIVMGVSGAEAAGGHRRHSMILVPPDTPGVEVRRGMRVFGYT